MTYKLLDQLTQEYRLREREIWRDLEFKLYQKHLRAGYTMWFSEVMASQEVLELRSMPKNVLTMTVPPEQTTQSDLD